MSRMSNALIQPPTRCGTAIGTVSSFPSTFPIVSDLTTSRPIGQPAVTNRLTFQFFDALALCQQVIRDDASKAVTEHDDGVAVLGFLRELLSYDIQHGIAHLFVRDVIGDVGQVALDDLVADARLSTEEAQKSSDVRQCEQLASVNLLRIVRHTLEIFARIG